MWFLYVQSLVMHVTQATSIIMQDWENHNYISLQHAHPFPLDVGMANTYRRGHNQRQELDRWVFSEEHELMRFSELLRFHLQTNGYM